MPTEDVLDAVSFAGLKSEYDRLLQDHVCPECDHAGEGVCPACPCICPETLHDCRCGCGTTIRCPGGGLCRTRILRQTGSQETAAVRAWMRKGLCVCSIVIRNYERPNQCLSDKEYTKSSGNWPAARRRKLGQCPCGAFYCNDAVRSLGLYSESEWKRKGYRYFADRSDRYSLDPATARWAHPFLKEIHADGSTKPLTHVRRGPRPAARIWRAFYDFRSQRFTSGLYSVDLFSRQQIDTGRAGPSRDDLLRMKSEICKQWVPGDKFLLTDRREFGSYEELGFSDPDRVRVYKKRSGSHGYVSTERFAAHAVKVNSLSSRWSRLEY